MNAFKFKPQLKSVLWGGDKILRYKEIESRDDAIGECWEISGLVGHESVVSEGSDAGLTLSELISKYGAKLVGKHVYEKYGTSFPLLIKIIDARADLSVQVHPDDAIASKRHNSLGKTEMWYIISTEPGAKIYSGFSRQIDRDEYIRLIGEGRIMEVTAVHDSHPGDIFYIPAGRIHSIGAGNMLVEIQEASDITYRVYDFNRRGKDGKLRELHTELASDAIDYNLYSNYKEDYDRSSSCTVKLIECPHFSVRRTEVGSETESMKLPTSEDSFTIIFCVSGSVTINGASLNHGESMLVSAEEQSLAASGTGVVLTITA